MNTKISRVEERFTLSAYEYGKHRIEGPLTEEDITFGRASFRESLSPILDMISQFKDWPLGSKVIVTMEILPNKEI